MALFYGIRGREILRSRQTWSGIAAIVVVSGVYFWQCAMGKAICAAAAAGNTPRVEQLLRQGASPNAVGSIGPDDDCDCEDNPSPAPALILAIYQTESDTHEHFETVEALLKAGADVNARNHEGMTALMWAQSPRMVKLLLAHGARTDLQSSDGDTALQAADEDDHPAVQAALRAAGERE